MQTFFLLYYVKISEDFTKFLHFFLQIFRALYYLPLATRTRFFTTLATGLLLLLFCCA